MSKAYWLALFFLIALCFSVTADAAIVTVNSDRTISIDGVKFFPIGAYTESDWAGC